jgi:hypothetical protein
MLGPIVLPRRRAGARVHDDVPADAPGDDVHPDRRPSPVLEAIASSTPVCRDRGDRDPAVHPRLRAQAARLKPASWLARVRTDMVRG